MAYVFNADEMFEMACRMEENGTRFYMQMTEKISDASVKNMLTSLAEMEKGHKKVFETMREQLPSQEKDPTVFDPEGDTAQYLKAMADIHVFDKNADEGFSLPDDLSDAAKLRKVLRAAIDLEWASISFYLGLKEFVPENLGKDRLDDIIKEEMRHVTMLSSRLTSSTI